MFKFYRGTTFPEAIALGEGCQHHNDIFWCDSFEVAVYLSQGAVAEIILDELPPHFNDYQSLVKIKGYPEQRPYRIWGISSDYYEKDKGLYNHIEDFKIHYEGSDYEKS